MKSLVTLALILSVSGLMAQNRLSDKVYFGGGAGFSIGQNQTNISVFPTVGYKVTPNWSAGIGLTYQYVNFKIGNESSTLSNYGWSVFSRYALTYQFFTQVEFERLSFEYFPRGIITEATERLGYNSFLVGAGYVESLGGNASFMITALYNLLYDETDAFQPYNSPIVIRAGIGIGF